MSNPFFLTRQTANLMEDFSRALAEPGSLFLLYGEPGVGKTRLLRELRDNRLDSARVHWIDMRGVSDGQIVQVDRSSRIEEVFSAAESGDVIVVDHFEIALKKSRHQLFVCWAEAGQEKGLNLVIACAREGFNELRQLSQQYQVRIESFELMPLANDEVESLLGFHLFPDHPVGRLDIPKPLRRRLTEARGIITRVLEIADEDGSHIRISAAAAGHSGRRITRIIVTALMLAAIVAGIGWYLVNRPAPMLVNPSPAPAPVTEPAPPVVAPEPDPPETGAASEVAETRAVEPEAVESTELDATGDVPAVADENSNEVDTQATARDDNVDTVADESARLSPPAEAKVEAVQTTRGDDAVESTIVDVEPEAGTVSDGEAGLIEPVADPVNTAAPDESTPVAAVASDDWPARFENKINNSLDWLRAREEATGTVQILLLTHEGFDPQAYFEYIDELVARGIDEQQLRIYKTLTGGRVVYSVFYGEYATRQEAFRSFPQLPEALRELDPIARSVGGIRNEIRRLEGQN